MVKKPDLIQCVYCGKENVKPRFKDDECDYCENCEDQANEVGNKNIEEDEE